MAASYHMKIGDIIGESADHRHKEWIDLLSFTFGSKRATVSGGVGQGPVRMDEIAIIKRVDASSVRLLEAHLRNELFEQATIESSADTQAQETYLEIVLKKAFVTGYALDMTEQGRSGSVDSFTLAFEEIEVEYRPLKSSGQVGNNIRTSWRRSGSV